MRTLRRVLLGVLAMGLMVGQGLVASTASASGADHGKVRIEPTPRVYGETRGELMVEMWKYFYQRQAGDPEPECLSIGKGDRVLIGAHDSTCTLKHGRPVMWFWSNTCDTKSPPPFYGLTEEEQLQCARDGLLPYIDYVKVVVDGVSTTVSTPRFEVISHQFSFVSPENNVFGYEPGPGTASAVSWVPMIYLPQGHHVLQLKVKYLGGNENVVTKTVDVVP
jgi:hypothetical protein